MLLEVNMTARDLIRVISTSAEIKKNIPIATISVIHERNITCYIVIERTVYCLSFPISNSRPTNHIAITHTSIGGKSTILSVAISGIKATKQRT